MSKRIDGWTLMARIAAHPHKFSACAATAGLASLLLVRSQLVQGVATQQDLLDLAEVVGPETLREVVENLAGYEALRVADNIGWSAESAGDRKTAAARRWLISVVRGPEREPAPAKSAPQKSPRTLRGHRAMGAKRVRTTG